MLIHPKNCIPYPKLLVSFKTYDEFLEILFKIIIELHGFEVEL